MEYNVVQIDKDDATFNGHKFADEAWLLSSRDVWYPNPYYKGEPQPHPESPEALGE